MLENHKDMIVNLYALGEYAGLSPKLREQGILIRKPLGPEMYQIVEWVGQRFGKAWASETEIAICNKPVSCLIAVKNNAIAGFACYDSTALCFFGPMGIDAQLRSSGIGTALLINTLYDMRAKGYAYAIIGLTDKFEFYRKAVGAVEIADSGDGMWKSWLGRE